MKVQINNKQPRILGTCTGRRLVPGKNVFDMEESELKTILANEQFKGWQKLAWVAFVQGPIEKQEAVVEVKDLSSALEDVNVSQAKIMISACADPELLMIWHERDRRKGIKDAIEERVSLLEIPEDQDGE